MPLALVAIQPPKVESSMESGSIPIVTPCCFNDLLGLIDTVEPMLSPSSFREAQNVHFKKSQAFQLTMLTLKCTSQTVVVGWTAQETASGGGDHIHEIQNAI